MSRRALLAALLWACAAAPAAADGDPLKAAVKAVADAKRELAKQQRELKRAVDAYQKVGGNPQSDRADVAAAKKEVAAERADVKKAAAAYKKAEERYQNLKGGVPYDPSLYAVVSELENPAPAGGGDPGSDRYGIPNLGAGREVTEDDAAPSGPIDGGRAGAAPPPPEAAMAGPGPQPGFGPGGGGPASRAFEEMNPPPAAAEAARPPGALDAESGARALAEPSAGGERSLFQAERALGRGDWAGALTSAQTAVREAPGSADAHRALSQALARSGRWEEAASEAAEAARINPRDGASQRALAWALLHTGKFEAAVEAAARAIALNPKDAEAYALRSFAYERLGLRSSQLADLRRAAALDPARFARHLARAEAGKTVFDPSDKDSWRLLEAEAPARGLPWGGALAAAAAALLALGLLPFWRRLNLQDVDVVLVSAGRRGPAVAQDAALLAQAERDGLLAGKYQLTQVIGRGGMAQVWEARDLSLKRSAAVKKIHLPEGPRAESRRQLALQEARTLASLRHPNIVDIYEVLELPAGLFLVFEFLHGKTLQQILAEERRLPWPRLKEVLRPVCAALEFAHERGFVHRDLKPSNIMVSGEARVKVMDFGIARAVSEGDSPVEAVAGADGGARGGLVLGRTSNLVGTPGYRPPEAEKGIVSTAFDVYSLGAVAFEGLTGDLPPRPGPGSVERVLARLTERAAALPPAAARAIQSALEPEMGRRPSTVQFFRCQALDI